MSIKSLPALAVAAGLVWASILPAAAAHRHPHPFVASSDSCHTRNILRLCATDTRSSTVDNGLSFHLFWEPPLSESTNNGGIGAVPPPISSP
jgi:hypothetical protein